MEERILLSVVIATFNSGLMTCKSLNALTSQTLSHGKFEIIVVDNNSTDDSLNQIKEFTKKYDYISVYTETKQGVSNARNRGIEEASGEYILFLDGTKQAGENIIQLVMDHFLNQKPEPLSVGGRYVPRFEGKKPFWFDDSFEIRDWGDKQRFLNAEEARTGFVGGVCAFRKDLLLKVNGFNPNLGPSGNKARGGEEPDLYRKISELQSDNTETIFYDPDIKVYTRVPKERLTLRYRLQRGFGFGVSARDASARRRSLPKYLASSPMPFIATFSHVQDIFGKQVKLSTKLVMLFCQVAWYAGYYWTR